MGKSPQLSPPGPNQVGAYDVNFRKKHKLSKNNRVLFTFAEHLVCGGYWAAAARLAIGFGFAVRRLPPTRGLLAVGRAAA